MVVTTVLALLSVSESGSVALTVAVLLTEPAVVGVTTTVTVALAFPARSPRVQEIVLVPL
jgi:hypothetical protein